MNAHPLGRAAAGLATAVTLTLTCGVGAASAATGNLTATQEDPTTATYLNGAPISATTLVGVGSDTTQDVEYGVAQDLGTVTDGSANVASWTATGTTPLTYRSGGAPAGHPNGSGAGFKALEESVGLIPSTGDSVGIGDVDFARAASFQGTQIPGGALTEIPFAYDSITFAVPAGSPFLRTNAGKGLQIKDFVSVYTGTDTYIDTATGDLLTGSTPVVAGDPTEPIQGFLPKPGSGVRQTFLKALSTVNLAVPYGPDKGDSSFTAAYPTTPASPYVGAQTSAGTPAQQNDASVLETAPAGVAAIIPFSTAKFIGYHNGIIADPSTKTAGTDYTVVPFDSAPTDQNDPTTGTPVLPYTASDSTYVPNATYQTAGKEKGAVLAFEAFNIVPTAEVANPNASAKSRAIYDTFAGGGSKFCLDTATIQAYGFLKDANCGNTSRTAGSPSAANVTVTNTAAVAGRSTVFTVSVQSNGNGGGTVAFTANGVTRTGTIAAGSTSVQITVPTPTAGTFSYGNGDHDGFTPNLTGVGPAPINPTPGTTLTYTVAKATASVSVSASAPNVSHLRTNGYALVKVAATGLAPTGSVTVVLKTTTGVTKYTFAAKALSGGSAKVLFNKALAKGTYYVWVSYSGTGNINAKQSARLAKLTVL